MKNIAVIPARSGSKGLKDKNIKLLNNIPLLAYSINAAKESELFECIHVSTDSQKYADIAKQYGADIDFLRTPKLSSDDASTLDAMIYVLEGYEKIGKQFDTLTILQPTSPLRTGKDIKNAFEIFNQKNAESVVSVCEMEHSPLWSNVLPYDNSLEGFLRAESDKRRQELDTYYRINGAIYIQKTSAVRQRKTMYGKNCYAYKMDSKCSVDIDSELDFLIAETIIKADI